MNPTPTPKSFEVLAEEAVYRGFFHLTRLRFRHTLFQGGWSDVLTRELFHRTSCVAVLPYDAARDRVVLIEQFRVGAMRSGVDPWLLEIVAGAVEPGEEPETVAHREAWEESGCRLQGLIRISEFFTSPGGSSERVTLFCGLIDSEGLGGVYGLEEEQEDIRVTVVRFAEAMQLIENGRIDSAVPIVGLQWLALHRDEVRRQWVGV